MKGKLFLARITLLVRGLVAIAGLAGMVGIIGWMSGIFSPKVEPGWSDRVPRVAGDQPLEEIHELVRPVIEEAIGTLRASSRTNVASRVLATIDEIRVVSGQEVKRGDVLVTLDAQEYQRRTEQATQTRIAAESAQRLAEADFERFETLRSQNAVSQAELDAVASRLAVTRAQRARADEMVAEAEVMLSYQTIRASKDGKIVDRYAEPGDLAQPGAPLLSMYDAESLRLETPVMEHLATRLKVGDVLTARIDALGREVPATVREIVPQADAASRSFLVKSAIDYSPDLYEGMFGRLRIAGGERRHLCINTDAIIRIGQLEYVDVVLDSGEVERRLVRTGQLGVPGRQEVLSGVEAGDRVLVGTTREAGQ